MVTNVVGGDELGNLTRRPPRIDSHAACGYPIDPGLVGVDDEQIAVSGRQREPVHVQKRPAVPFRGYLEGHLNDLRARVTEEEHMRASHFPQGSRPLEWCIDGHSVISFRGYAVSSVGRTVSSV
ncbi:hypothetical protein ABZ678_16175, partial [Streptomyces hirsutus]|uniref:hypothetical protein n=1 Tax=Streptomyces hirsutus TaxID=35620 RepID=UPI0033CD431A